MNKVESTDDYKCITTADLIRLDSLNFKLVPLSEDAKTPTQSTNEIYENPNYWTPDRLERESYKFKNVATMLGKTRTGLYRNELDIDSANVANILSNLAHGEKEYSFVLNMQKVTYVVKTKKLFGYRIYWDSTKPNKPIHTSDCKPGYEFEIKTDNTSGHSTLPPSRHRDDFNFQYVCTGLDKVGINDEIYDKLIRLLSDCLKPKSKEKQQEKSTKETELNNIDIEAIADFIAPFYKKGFRNSIILALSGLLHRFNISYDSALNIIQTVIKDDDEKRSRIGVLEETYRKKPIEVSGTKYLLSVLESVGCDKGRAKEVSNILVDIIGKKRKKHILIALEILESERFVTLQETDEILVYRCGVYVRGGDVEIKKIIQREYIDDATITLRREVIEHIKCLTYQPIDSFDTDLNIINKPNGLYHIDTDILTPHTPDYLSMVQNPIPYIKDAKPKLFGKFLNKLVYPTDIRTLVDSMSYTFWRSNPFEIIIVLVADGSNGKSVLFTILGESHGWKNVSNVSLEKLIDRPFGTYALVGKNCNLDAELTNKPIEDTALLKKLTGNQPQYVEGKNKEGFEVRIYTKIWMSANNMLNILNPTSADYRRFTPIPLPNQFDDEADPKHGIYKVDTELTKNITTVEELAGIFNVMMVALRRILKNGKIFLHDNTIKKRREKFDLTADPLKVFIEDVFMPEEERVSYEWANEKKDDVFDAYTIFRKEKKLPIMSKESLGKALKAKGLKDGRFTYDDGERYMCWRDVRLSTEWYLRIKPHEGGRQGTIG